MRIWDIEPQRLCRSHLLGEHRELHALWIVISKKKKGYSYHPETLRWAGKLKALFIRHEALVEEMGKRGYHHKSPLDARLAKGMAKQNEFVNSLLEQEQLLKSKGCDCRI